MIHAYDESYLDDAMCNLGDMLEYAICDCGYEPDVFFLWFILSGIAAKFEKGNPKYITGMSGVELADAVIFLTHGTHENIPASQRTSKGAEYWAGWIMAYYQWYRNLRFADMIENGLPVSKVLSLYLLHEADESKFVETADGIIEKEKASKPTNLKRIRTARELTQEQLSEASGVALHTIRLYEQKEKDINQAQASVILQLAKVLGCQAEDLMEL